MTMKRLALLMFTAAIAFTTMAYPRNNILNVRTDITDNDIVYPESFETNTQEMFKNWYLQNYAILDAEVENRDYGDVSDAVIIKRLQDIPTTIELPFNQVVRSYIDRYVKRSRTLVEQMLGMSLYYMPIFEQALDREEVPLELKYLPIIESAMNPNAVSRAGAAGLWQFMVGTGKGLGLEVSTLVDERRDPIKSSEKAAKYLRNLHDIYGNWSLAIAAYNCGPGNVNKALRRSNKEDADFWDIYDYLPKETRGYVPAFIAATYVMNYYKQHNISPSLAKRPLITDTVGVTRRIHFNQISKVLNVSVDELRALNPQYRHDVIPGTKSKPYFLILPSQQVTAFIMSEDSISGYMASSYTPREVVEPGGFTSSAADYNSTITVYHKVRKGETINSIASQYGMAPYDLITMNDLRTDDLKVGQSLKVTSPKANNYSNDDDITAVDHSDNYGDYNYNNPEQEAEQEAEVMKVQEQAQSAHIQKVYVEVPPAPKKQESTRSVVPPRNNNPATPATTTKSNPNQTQQNRENNYKNTHSSGNRNQAAEQPQKQTKGQQNKGHQAESAANNKQASGKQQQTKAQQAAAAKQEQPQNYNVKKGESLTSIAAKTGVSVEEIKKANNLKDDNIKIGENIKIPAKGKAATTTNAKQADKKQTSDKKQASDKKAGKNSKAQAKQSQPQNHSVKKGESLSQIAEKNGVTVAELKKANNIKGDNIKIGENIKIPAKGKDAAATNAKADKKANNKQANGKNDKQAAAKGTGKKGGKKK